MPRLGLAWHLFANLHPPTTGRQLSAILVWKSHRPHGTHRLLQGCGQQKELWEEEKGGGGGRGDDKGKADCVLLA